MNDMLIEELPVTSPVSRSRGTMRRLSDFVRMDGDVYVPVDPSAFRYAYFFDRATLLPYHPMTIKGDVLEVCFPSGDLSFVNNLELLSNHVKLVGLGHEQILKSRKRDFELLPSVFDARFPLVPHLRDYHLGKLGEEKQIIRWLHGKAGEVPSCLRLAYHVSESIRADQWLDEHAFSVGIEILDSEQHYRSMYEGFKESLQS